MRQIIPFIVIGVIGIFIFGCSSDDNGPTTPTPPPPPRLVAAVHQDPGLDTVDNAIWDSIVADTIPVGTKSDYNSGVFYTTQLKAEMKALVAGNYLYIRAKWNDSDQDDRFGELRARQFAGTNVIEWELVDTVTVKNEDRFYILFDQGGPNGADCASMCHTTANSAGRKLYGASGDNADVWHWKAHRTGLAGFAEDMHMTDTSIAQDPQDQTPNDNLYFRNVHMYVSGSLCDHPIRIHPDTTEYTGAGLIEGEYIIWNDAIHASMPWVPGLPTDSIGVRYPGYFLNPISGADGSRWDVHAKSTYDGANWIVVFRRLLATTDNDDINFSSLDSVSISIAIGNNSGINHWGHEPFYLVFP